MQRKVINLSHRERFLLLQLQFLNLQFMMIMGELERIIIDGSTELVDQTPPKPTAPLVEPELRRSTREQQPYTRYPSHEYVMLTDGGEPECFEEAMSHQH